MLKLARLSALLAGAAIAGARDSLPPPPAGVLLFTTESWSSAFRPQLQPWDAGLVRPPQRSYGVTCGSFDGSLRWCYWGQCFEVARCVGGVLEVNA